MQAFILEPAVRRENMALKKEKKCEVWCSFPEVSNDRAF
jgi:hypothetical protein